MSDFLVSPITVMIELAKSFAPNAIESYWYQTWEAAGYFQPSMQTQQPAFCIQLPPPNVTGTLHMGHAFNQTIMDSLCRYHRMKGENVLWVPGTDHAGIATQIVVERQLALQGLRRHNLGREAFIEKIWSWKQQSGHTITKQMRRMGCSVDWSREYFTMDAPRAQAVVTAFVRLFEEGLIYRGKRLVNWDPQLGTAVSDLEVVNTPEQGKIWYIRYPLADDSNAYLSVATTRPETMLGDVAVMVHPEDPRYQSLLGKQLRLPLTDRLIPIIADPSVDPHFASGAVKVTPAHDFNDYAVALRHQLPQINIFTLDGHIDASAPSAYRGLNQLQARQKIIDDLQALGLLEAVKAHSLTVPRSERSGAIIEPMLTDQWFVAMRRPTAKGRSFAEQAMDAVDSGKVQFFPAQWLNTYRQWIENIQDWCISRQLWWGHQIPAWYDQHGQYYVAVDEAGAQKLVGDAPLRRDSDVLDTWFSSALLPFSSLGWPENNQALQTFLPSNVLVTGYEIIFFWVARMIMFSSHFVGKVPFKHVYIHGVVRDAEGKKMSKSEGNTIDPVDLIEGIDLAQLLVKRTTGLRRPEQADKIRARTQRDFPQGIPAFGTDALRFSMATYASLGRHINFDFKRCEGYRNFCNKLWNASRFVLLNTPATEIVAATHYSFADQWILSRLQHTIEAVSKAFDTYRLDLASQAIYDFIWHAYCDWYVELAKTQLSQPNMAAATRHALLHTLEVALRLVHPIMPFISEALWQKVAALIQRKTTASIMLAPWPTVEQSYPQAEAQMQHLQALVLATRALRATMKLSPAQKVPLYLEGEDSALSSFVPYLQALCRLSAVHLVTQLPPTDSPVQVVGEQRLMLAVQTDSVAEQQRLRSEIAALEQQIARAQTKLSNAAFMSRAPAAIVTQEQERLANFNATKNKLCALLAQYAKETK